LDKNKEKDNTGAYALIVLAMRLSGYFAMIVVFSTLLSWSAPTPESPTVRDLLEWLMSIQAFFTDVIKNVFPKIAGGKYESGVYLILLAFVFKLLLTDTVQIIYKNKIEEFELQGKMDEINTMTGSPGHKSNDFAPMRKKFEAVQSGDNASRAELLRLFAETKKKLDSMVRDLAFLSIDVVGSTAMKDGESKSLVQATFNEYKIFVTEKLKSNGVLKSAWTPDGVMICFPTADSAVKAAKDILKDLPTFNRDKKSIKSEFKVRCGVSAGRVHYDDSTPMEEMSDNIIDVAGHMQKYAVPDGIFIPKYTYDKLRTTREGFLPANKVIDGHDTFAWTGKK
jgi:class 3 adenylate cyclase